MSGLFSQSEADALAEPHVVRSYFGRFDLPWGVSYLHQGVGPITIGGNVWKGISDPTTGRLCAVGEIMDPQFGQAASVDITLTGMSREFLQEVFASRADLEGRRADILTAIFDAETLEQKSDLIPLFPFGRMTAPRILRQGLSVKTVVLTVESLFQATNYPPGGRWTPADRNRLYPGDKGWDYVGQQFQEFWQ